MTRRGIFVVFEGGEGGGKSTQVARLADSLRARGADVLVTREPGGVPSAEAIRDLVLDPQYSGLDPRAEALLFAAARAEHVAGLIAPALAAGTVVICDRFIDSSIAYQGVARGLGVRTIAELSAWATGGLAPDITVVLDVDPQLGLQRAGRVSVTRDRLESESMVFHRQVRQAFLDQSGADPDRYLVLDATQSAASLGELILARVATLLDGRESE